MSLFGASGCGGEAKEGLPPTVTLDGDKIFRISLGESILLSPSYSQMTEQTAIRWLLDGQVVGTQRQYLFSSPVAGVFYLTVEVSNEWGTGFLEMRIDVYDDTPPPVTPPEPAVDSVHFHFDSSEYHVSQGRTIRLLPLDPDTTKTCTFTWSIDGTTVQQGSEALYRFEAAVQGRYNVECRVEEAGVTLVAHTLTVVVCPPEGIYRRPASTLSSPEVEKVYDFTPAPGQFVNENYTARTMEEACAYALARMRDDKYVSLGGFGGSIVVGFDHSIANEGGYSFAIRNSVMTNYSEPGIVWVMQDENGDGLPNDTWYELKGSDYGLEGTLSDHAVTYYRPSAAAQPVPWTDNRGGSGAVAYMAAFHTQDSYYPAWVTEDHYTLRGTRLEAHNYDSSGTGTLWINPDYGWGYADNYSETDMAPGGTSGATAGCNHFRIDDAVTFDGQPARLQYIDFIKVQTGLNTQSGWLGEVSTEVTGFIDYNLVK